MVYTKNTSRKQDFETFRIIVDRVFPAVKIQNEKWDKNNWVSRIDLSPNDTKKQNELFDIKKCPNLLTSVFREYGFKIIKSHSSTYFQPGTWSTNPKGKERYFRLHLMIGKISEKYKWRNDRI